MKMGIPESQLHTWSKQGAVQTAKATHESLRNALTAKTPSIRDKDFEVYLQGSYKNGTNIRGDSDVDVIARLNSTFKPDTSELSEHEKILWKAAHSDATYLWTDFWKDVVQALEAYYGASVVSPGNKSVKVAKGSGRLPVDVVVCLVHRKYQRFGTIADQLYVEGIAFYALREKRWVINFPKAHYDNGVKKNAQHRTNGWYKPTVRIFKNARTYLVDKGIIADTLAPSYFLESLLYNVPDEYFGTSYRLTFSRPIGWLISSFANGRFQDFKCQNEQLPLFGGTPEQWSPINALELLRRLIEL